MANGTARERLLDAAARRFYDDGVHATGIDAIISEAGVARKSLYNNFTSKAALVDAYLAERHEEWLDLHRERAAAASTLAARVLAVFDAYLDHARGAYAGGFRGCGLLNAAAEFPSDHPARRAVRAHKEQVEEILADELTALTVDSRARELAEHFSFLLEGAVARAGLEGGPERLVHARGIAARMLEGL
jgi:AcrR family transcriptional regulator